MDSRLEDLLADKMNKKRYEVKGACPQRNPVR
jgi:hypothetical protein